MRQYWQFNFYVDGRQKTRYFYGTPAAAERRAKRYTCDSRELRRLSKSKAQYLKAEKNARFITL
jgi:hypothetical protein